MPIFSLHEHELKPDVNPEQYKQEIATTLRDADSTVKCNRGFRFLSRKEYLKGSFVV